MARARIADGIVAELIESAGGAPPLAERFHPDIVAQLQPASVDVRVGWRWDGARFLPPEGAALAPVVPPVIALWQFRRELRARGWWDKVLAAIATLPREARADAEEWLEYGTEAQRASPLLQALARAVGLSHEMDDAFLAAGRRAL